MLRPLFCLEKILSIIVVTSKKYCLSLHDTDTINLETTGPSNKTTEQHIPTKKCKTGVPNIFHHLLTRIHGRQIAPDSNPLDDAMWDEFAQAINWDNVISKSSLISELKRDVKKISSNVVRKSWSVWPNPLYRMTQNDENYLRE